LDGSTCSVTLSNQNYTPIDVGAAFVVNKAPITITVKGSQTFGGSPTFVATTNVSGVTATSATCARTTSQLIAPRLAAGSYARDKTTCSATLSNVNYAPTYVGSSFVVAKAVLTVIIGDSTRVFRAPNPTFTYILSGFVSPDDATVVTGKPTLSTTALATSHPGTYAINGVKGAMNAANYSFAFVPGTLTIAKAPIKIVGKPVSIIRTAVTLKATFSATVTNAVTGVGSAGQTVTFAMTIITGHVFTCTAVTNGAGVATCATTTLLGPALTIPPTYAITVLTDVDYLAGAGTGKVTL
jgi:hypothetical protein